MRQWNIYKGLKMLKVFNSAQSNDPIGPIYVSPINTNVSFNDNSTQNKLIYFLQYFCNKTPFTKATNKTFLYNFSIRKGPCCKDNFAKTVGNVEFFLPFPFV